MTKKPPAPKDDEEQSRRFIEAARELGVDETGGDFERAIRSIQPKPSDVKNPPPGKPRGGQTS